MDIEDPRHLLRPPRASGRAVGFAIVTLLTIWLSLAQLEGWAQLVAALFLVLVGIWGVAAMLRVDHRFMDLVAIVGLVLALAPLLHSLRSETQRSDEPTAGPSTTPTAVTSTTTTSTTVASTMTGRPATTVPTTAPQTTAAPTPTIATTELNHIVSFAERADGGDAPRCLDVPGGRAGSPVQISDCSTAASMEWVYVEGRIQQQAGDLCITRVGPSMDHARIVAAPCNDADAGQAWSLDGRTFVNGGAHCLDVDRDDDRTVQLFHCDGNPEQEWAVE